MQWGHQGPPPLLIKLAPDLTDADKSDVATVCLRLGVDGLVVSNTTITRPGAVADHPTGSEVSTYDCCWLLLHSYWTSAYSCTFGHQEQLLYRKSAVVTAVCPVLKPEGYCA